MPTEKACVTCKHYRPFEGSKNLSAVYAKCVHPLKQSLMEFRSSDKHFVMPSFAETCRTLADLCGPTGRWWQAKDFELVEEDNSLRWNDEDVEEDD